MGEKITLQRRSLKVDVQLSAFATFSIFEKHVASKFELETEVSLSKHFSRYGGGGQRALPSDNPIR